MELGRVGKLARFRFCAALLLSLVVCVSTASAQEQPTETAPTSQPASAPASQPTTTQAALDKQQEAGVRKELAEQEAEKAKTELESVRKEKERSQETSLRKLPAKVAERRFSELELDEDIAEWKVRASERRIDYAERQNAGAARVLKVEEAKAEIRAQLAQMTALSAAERAALADKYDELAEQQRGKAEPLRSEAAAAKAAATEPTGRRRELQERWDTLTEGDPLREKTRAALDRLIDLVDNQQLIAYELAQQADTEIELAEAYEQAAEELRAYNRRFWIQHAYLLGIGRILLAAIVAHFGLNVLAWVITAGVRAVARGLRGQYATPTVKRARTLVQFGRSILKLLVWVVAIVTILAEFGIQPGQSAGALGIIGLVLAGMFQQLVVDFVKGIDIAIGGHYFVGDFVQVGAHAGHVLDFTVKYTVLRTPSGQVITIPNSQCIPSRRFPLGYVDNYIDVPLAPGADLPAARERLQEVGRLLNERIEAMKREPEVVGTYPAADRTIVRMQVRVLPTCDWVVKDHFIPKVKEQLAAANIALAGEPEFFYVNDIPTFRRLFSRQMTDREMQATLATESRPTIQREAIPDEGPAAEPSGPSCGAR